MKMKTFLFLFRLLNESKRPNQSKVMMRVKNRRNQSIDDRSAFDDSSRKHIYQSDRIQQKMFFFGKIRFSIDFFHEQLLEKYYQIPIKINLVDARKTLKSDWSTIIPSFVNIVRF